MYHLFPNSSKLGEPLLLPWEEEEVVWLEVNRINNLNNLGFRLASLVELLLEQGVAALVV